MWEMRLQIHTSLVPFVPLYTAQYEAPVKHECNNPIHHIQNTLNEM